jgi:tRNA-2-methylthio-N6-dimethylallyladenosine synthase
MVMSKRQKTQIIDESIQGTPVFRKEGGKGKAVYIESYGCQMNFSDSEIVASILIDHGFSITHELNRADAVFLNTCAIRENAEQRVRNRLKNLQGLKKKKQDLTIGILGCMAERLRDKLLEEEKLVDLVAGPDAYRDPSFNERS